MKRKGGGNDREEDYNNE
jgi:hypothetical protein